MAAFDRSLAISRESGNRLWEMLVAPKAVALEAHSGDPARALARFATMLDVWRRTNDVIFASHGLGSLIILFERIGRPGPAAVLDGTLSRLFEANPFVANLPDTSARVRTALGDATFDDAVRQGGKMSLTEAADYALDQIRRALQDLAPATVSR
jgi:hypothetical protein